MSLTKEYKASPEIKAGGVKCPCCNDYHGKSRRKPFRNLRRKAKQQLRTLEYQKMSTMPFNQKNVRAWMKANKRNHVDSKTGEINYTSLAEECCNHFDVADEGGPLDDETHWVWEIATEV